MSACHVRPSCTTVDDMTARHVGPRVSAFTSESTYIICPASVCTVYPFRLSADSWIRGKQAAISAPHGRLAVRHEWTSTLVRQLHWLRVPDRITFKLATLMFQCVNGTAPGYLSSDVRRVVLFNSISSSYRLHADV